VPAKRHLRFRQAA